MWRSRCARPTPRHACASGRCSASIPSRRHPRSPRVHLLFAAEPQVPDEGHVAVVAEDYDATLLALREAGFEAQPRTQHWGSPRAFVRCPAGHRVEVMAVAPA
jgi:catechol 2,3-dioxygenase-like lactoylglutathione lyase family enzyme